MLDKYIDLYSSCLTKEERKVVIEMLCRYREAFSLTDEIGTCPSIEVDIDVTDKSPFLYDLTMSRKKIKTLIDKEMKSYVI